jgi:hypothetical protein
VFRVNEIEIGDVIDHAPVYLFRHILIEAPIASLHVVHRHTFSTCYQCPDGAVGVAKDEQRVRMVFVDERLDAGQGSGEESPERTGIAGEYEVGSSQAKILKQHGIELRIVILPCVDDDVI